MEGFYVCNIFCEICYNCVFEKYLRFFVRDLLVKYLRIFKKVIFFFFKGVEVEM